MAWRDSIAPETRAKLNTKFARRAPAWLKRRTGHPLASPIDLARVELLRHADMASLRDAEPVARMLPELGLNDEAPELFPPELRSELGRGLRCWQYPHQLAPYLVLASTLGVRRYLEIGVQHGGTFVVTVEYLARFGPVERAVATDILDVPDLRRYGRIRPGARLVRRDSGSATFRRLAAGEGPWDLVLIDGDHRREAVRRDWDIVRPHARAIAFHDIVDAWCPGVRETWSEIRAEHAADYEFHEFTAQYDEVSARTGSTHLGIGLAIRRDDRAVNPGR